MNTTSISSAPSGRLMRAAISGLLAVGAAACGDDSTTATTDDHDKELTDKELTALCQDKVDEAVTVATADKALATLCSDMVAAAEDKAKPTDAELTTLCADMVQTSEDACVVTVQASEDACTEQLADLREKGRPLLYSTEEKIISEEQQEYTFAALTTLCDDRGGYTQIHAACGGHNACAGFSYGDWGPGAAMFTEHLCSGVNGCLGLSCVVLPADEGRTGKEIYEDAEFAEPLGGCGGCHGGYYDAGGAFVHDLTYFDVEVLEGSTRTVDNWLDRTAAEQERVVAFGAHSVLADGTAIENMAAYHRVLSRAETEAVVAHIRTLTPYIHTMKTKDAP
jgi:mono/diheme cytochrome c family protein